MGGRATFTCYFFFQCKGRAPALGKRVFMEYAKMAKLTSTADEALMEVCSTGLGKALQKVFMIPLPLLT